MLGKTPIGKYRVVSWRERCVARCMSWAAHTPWDSCAAMLVGLLAILPAMMVYCHAA